MKIKYMYLLIILIIFYQINTYVYSAENSKNLTVEQKKEIEGIILELDIGYKMTDFIQVKNALSKLQKYDKKASPIYRSIFENNGFHKYTWLYAIERLGELKDREAVMPLVKILNNRKKSKSIRHKTARALGKIGTLDIVEPLGKILTNKVKTSQEKLLKEAL